VTTNSTIDWLDRAHAGWQALRPSFRPVADRYLVHERRKRSSIPLWPFSQVLHTAMTLAPHDHDAHHDLPLLINTLETFRRDRAYSERPTNRRRYYDDNAWIALAELNYTDHHAGRAVAARVMGFLEQGARAFPDDQIAIGWVEKGDTFNACSTGSTGLAARRLSTSVDDHMSRLANGCLNFLTRSLTNSDGLIADHRRADGSIDAAIYTYNQGLAIGLLTESGDIDSAKQLAERTIKAFDEPRLWAHPPAFNAILMRELVVLYRHEPSPTVLDFIDTYLNRVWSQARDQQTGLFTAGGIGKYDSDVILDHAALTGAFTARGLLET
jgi:hypothetical protein